MYGIGANPVPFLYSLESMVPSYFCMMFAILLLTWYSVELHMPDCPKWLLPDAQEEWKRLSEKLNQMGVLTEVDRSAFAAYCQSYARWKEAQSHINSEGATYETENGMQRPNPWVAICNTEQRLMMQAASEFGLTPSARSRIMAASGAIKDDVDEMEALLGGEG